VVPPGEDFWRALGFSLGALPANRKGRLAPRQWFLVAGSSSLPLGIGAAAMGSGIFVVVFSIGAVSEVGGQALVVGVLGGVFVVFGLVMIVGLFFGLNRGHVAWVEGDLEKREEWVADGEGGQPLPFYSAKVATHRFDLSRREFIGPPEGFRYRIYYHSAFPNTAVNVEVVAESNLDPLE
jgi:hypothetical protein